MLPISVQNSTRLIAYLVIISQLHLHSAKLPEAEKSSNHLFCKSLLLLHNSSSGTFPISPPSWGSVTCAGQGAQRGLLQLPVGEAQLAFQGTHFLEAFKNDKQLEKKKVHTYTKKCHDIHNYIPRRRLGLYVDRYSPGLHAFSEIPEAGFQNGKATFSILFHLEHLNLPLCGCVMGTHSPPLLVHRGKHSSPVHPRTGRVLGLATITWTGPCFSHFM